MHTLASIKTPKLLLVAALAGLLGAGCAELRIQATCDRICECGIFDDVISPEECSSTCEANLASASPEDPLASDECYECLVGAECSTLLQDCSDVCGMNDDVAEPQPGEPT